MIQEMREWLADCFEDAPNDLTNEEIITAIERHYDGGVIQFKRDGNISVFIDSVNTPVLR